MAFFLPGVVSLTITTGVGLYYYLSRPVKATDNTPTNQIAMEPVIATLTNEIKAFDQRTLKPARERTLKPPLPTLEDSLRKVIQERNSSLNKSDDA